MPAPAVLLSVRDEGVGISPDDLPLVFTPFFRADRSRARHTGGVGLGLGLVKRIVETHGGEFTACSTLGEGSCFTVRLPLAEPDPRLARSAT